MSLRFIDGFDHYVTADIPKKWTSSAGGIAITAGQGRRGTASARSASDPIRYLTLTLDNQATWILGMAFRVTQLPSGTNTLFALLDGASLQTDVRLLAAGDLVVTRNGTVLGTAPGILVVNAYMFLEWLVTIHNTAGVSTVRLNGANILTLSSLDTQQTANAFANVLRVGTTTGTGHFGTLDMDDLYICDGTGSAPHNTFLGDCRVDTLLPNADATPLQWTPSTGTTHYTLVDEASPNTTDYVSSSTVGQRDLYGVQDLTTVTGTIYGTQLNLAVLKSDAGLRSVKTLIKSSASEVLGSAVALSTSQVYTRAVQASDPATSAAWTEAGVNAALFGAEVA